jgi:molecular chaperone Hsp33
MDELHTFLFEGKPVRGLFVRLSRGWPSLLSRREPGDEHPPPVRALLGEMTAAAVLMHANIRYAGTLILQILGDGPVKLAVVEVQPNLNYRATATVVGPVAGNAGLGDLVDQSGQGRCAITLDPEDKSAGQQPYQGVVDLRAGSAVSRSIADVLEHYMRQSEQLATRFVLGADDEGAGGMLVQQLPVEGEGNLEGGKHSDALVLAHEAFEHASHLVATLSADELLRVETATVMRRLFWQDDLRVFDVRHPAFACRCSRERVRSMLRALGDAEVHDILRERGEVEIACEFCGLRYRFDPIDVGELFTRSVDQPPGSSAIN